jgi:hypothetical protein
MEYIICYDENLDVAQKPKKSGITLKTQERTTLEFPLELLHLLLSELSLYPDLIRSKIFGVTFTQVYICYVLSKVLFVTM